MLSQLLNRSSTHLFTHTNCTLLLYSKILDTFSIETLIIQLYFWDCLDIIKWSSHLLVDKESKCLCYSMLRCHIQVHLSGKLHSRGDATSEPYKPAFHSGHLSHNTSHGGAATLRVFRLPRRRYSYSTQSSMTELILSVSQH